MFTEVFKKKVKHLQVFGGVRHLKGHWTTSTSSPDFFFKKVEIFIPLEVYTYVVTAC